MKKILFFTLLLFLYYEKTKAQPGTLDPTFGVGGHVVVGDRFAATEFQHDGKLLGAMKDGENLVVYRYNTDGTPDPTFGSGGIAIAHVLPVGDEIIALTEGIDGKIVVLNNIANSFPIGKVLIVRFDATGIPDNTFGVNGVSVTDYGLIHGANILHDIGLQSDGEIVLTSRIGTPGGSFVEYSRLNPSGKRVFMNQLVAPGYFHTGPTSMAIQGDGKIVVGGFASRLSPYPGNQFIFFLLRLNKDGTPDNTFGTNGMVLSNESDRVNSVVIGDDGKIIVAGSGNKIIRFTADGSLDSDFGQMGIVETEFEIKKIVLESNGDIIVAGGTESDFAVARYHTGGVLDKSFGTEGKSITDFGGYENITDLKIVGSRLFAYGTGLLAAYRLTPAPRPGIVDIKCPANIILDNDQGKCGALVNYPALQLLDESGQPVEGGSPNFKITQTAGLPSHSVFPAGSTTNTFSLQTETKTATCSFTVTVTDKEAPEIKALAPNKRSIWPPNHKMVDVDLAYTVADNCAAPDVRLSITSSEVSDLKKKELLVGDWQIIDQHHIQVRAEKNSDAERTYTVTVTATDKAGNKTEQQVTLTVPHDNSGKREAFSDAGNPDAKTTIQDAMGLSVKVLSNPTPADFTLITRSSSNSVLTMKVYDLLGRIVDAKTGLAANGAVQIGNQFRPGMYFAEVRQGDKTVTIKLIKQ